jgi:hypothetical protein
MLAAQEQAGQQQPYHHNRSPDTLGCVLTHLTQRGVSTIPPV